MFPLFRPVFLLIALAFIFTGSALAADDRWLPTSDRHSGAFQAASNSGEDLYQFWCSTCHGDKGQGLTPEWRATWPKGKQNCWQSKCHAANHPPDGFTIPKNVPALIGPDTLRKFNTAQDLYAYTRAAMPYWSPNLLKDDEYRAITQFLIKANYQEKGFITPATLPIDWTTLALHPTLKKEVELTSKTVDPSPQPTPYPLPSYSLPPTSYFLLPTPYSLLLVLAGLIAIFLARRFFSHPR